jgi:hypothetical protein
MEQYETVGVGRTVTEALQAYQSALVRGGQAPTVDDIVGATEVSGVVMRTVQIDGTFYVLLQQYDIEFYGKSDVYPELKWATTGDEATIKYQEGTGKSQPILGFDIKSVKLN